jgi:hypothetical protein
MRLQKWAAVFGLLAITTQTRAHHSYSAEFDTSKSVEVSGVISAISKVNPHVEFTLKVQDRATGKANELKVQVGPLRDLARKKLTEDRFKVGATVVVRGSPAKLEKGVLGAVSMTFPDGTVADGLNEWIFPAIAVPSPNPPK